MMDSAHAMAAASDPSAILDMAQQWKGLGEGMIKSLVDYFSVMESREKNLRAVSDSLAERSRDLEERERELEKFKVLQEGRSEALRLREEKLDEQLRLVNEHIEELEASQGEVEELRRKERENLKEIEKKNWESDVVRGLLERQLEEVGKRLSEFDVFHKGKLEELALKEELLCKERREFVEEVELANEKLKEKQRLGYGLIERLESTLDMLGGMKMIMDERFKEIESRETMAHESLTLKLNEADSIRESLEIRFKELEDIEKELYRFQEDKTRLLVSKEQLPDTTTSASTGRTEVKVEVGEGEKVCRPREVESESNLKEQGLEQSMLTDTIDGHLTIKSADLGCALQKDQKTLEMLIIDQEKDLELMDDEICEILKLSTEPAKLVLDTVQGFHALPSGELDATCKVRRARIVLLDQLTKMSPKIQPCVAAAAVKLAFEWKSKLSAMIEDPMEVLGFLHLVAAFHLSSNFNKNELFSFVKVVGLQKQTPELCNILGLTFKIPGYIQKLLNEKKYLLASSYVHEYQLQHKFKQATILSYYVAYSKFSANNKVRNERNAAEAQDKSTASEIADLRAGVAHIIKYGLESEYSPNVLTARIQQLEANRASLRHECPSSSPVPSFPADKQKQGNRKKGWKARRKFRQGGPNPQMPCDDFSNSWTAQHQPCNSQMHHGASPGVFPYPWVHVNAVPHHPHKRHRVNA